MDYYALLGVPHDADADTIRSAFRALARRYHPDAGAGSSVHRFREALTAYETLSEPGRRRRYDRTLDAPRPAGRSVVEPLHAEVVVEPLIPPRNIERMRTIHDWRAEDALEELIAELRRLWGFTS